MKEMVEVDGRAGLIEHLRKTHDMPGWAPLDLEKITVEPYGNGRDDRIGWKDTHIVHLEGYGVLGFTEGPADPP